LTLQLFSNLSRTLLLLAKQIIIFFFFLLLVVRFAYFKKCIRKKESFTGLLLRLHNTGRGNAPSSFGSGPHLFF